MLGEAVGGEVGVVDVEGGFGALQGADLLPEWLLLVVALFVRAVRVCHMAESGILLSDGLLARVSLAKRCRNGGQSVLLMLKMMKQNLWDSFERLN
ncbi:hypothetical protein NLG97_g8106 [Lecanicillium saksenae]|uniref:Uncharacterized protein n=1 Tax=Lecanicillium saksenae TaxID=468837 RepID=A0ACC1QL16_9HYPO|nr:hypothetical protein NLG97_g8106 [Lecanicillium saksenae]